MEGLRRDHLLMLIVAILHQTPSLTAIDAHKVLHIPEKIIGGVIDMVQNHKNKPSQQASFQQSVQTQTTFSQHGNPQGTPPANVPQQPWTGPVGFQGQAQVQGQGQYGNYINQGTGGNYQTAPVAPVYPVSTGPAPTGTPAQYPVNPGPYQPQQGFSQSQNQGQNQNYQNQGQFLNQNQGNFQGQDQNQGQNQNGQYQSGQYGSGNFQGTGLYTQSNGGNYQGQNGNYQGQNVGQPNGGNYQGQNVGQSNGAHYQGQNVGQNNGGNYQGQNGQTSGNHQYAQTGQYQGNPNGLYNQNQQSGQYAQSGQNQQSGYYQGTQQTSNQSGQNSSGSQTGSYGGSQSGGYQISGSQQYGGATPTCLCQAWTKPSNPQVLNDEPPKPDKIEKKTDDTKPTARAPHIFK